MNEAINHCCHFEKDGTLASGESGGRVAKSIKNHGTSQPDLIMILYAINMALGRLTGFLCNSTIPKFL